MLTQDMLRMCEGNNLRFATAFDQLQRYKGQLVPVNNGSGSVIAPGSHDKNKLDAYINWLQGEFQ